MKRSEMEITSTALLAEAIALLRVADLFLLTFHGQCATMAEMKGYRHE